MAVPDSELSVSITNPASYQTKRYLTAVAQKQIVSKLGECVYIYRHAIKRNTCRDRREFCIN